MFYGNKMRRKMKAGAGCEDLRVRCPHYYAVATRLHAAMQVRHASRLGCAWAGARRAGSAAGRALEGQGTCEGRVPGACKRHSVLPALPVSPSPSQQATHTPALRPPCRSSSLQACLTADEDFPAFILNTFRGRYKARACPPPLALPAVACLPALGLPAVPASAGCAGRLSLPACLPQPASTSLPAGPPRPASACLCLPASPGSAPRASPPPLASY